MAKSPKTKQTKATEIELVDDAWPRFEALVKSAAKMGHKPHVAPEPKKTKNRRRAV